MAEGESAHIHIIQKGAPTARPPREVEVRQRNVKDKNKESIKNKSQRNVEHRDIEDTQDDKPTHSGLDCSWTAILLAVILIATVVIGLWCHSSHQNITDKQQELLQNFREKFSSLSQKLERMDVKLDLLNRSIGGIQNRLDELERQESTNNTTKDDL